MTNLSNIYQRAVYRKEDARIVRHLRIAHAEVSANTPTELSVAQLAKREAGLKALSDFIDAGVFPRNQHCKKLTPYIRGDAGSVCAVASMIVSSGDVGLVNHLELTDNHMKLGQTDDNEFKAWLEQNGFSQEEAGRIQVPYMGPVHQTFFQAHQTVVLLGILVLVFLALQTAWYKWGPKYHRKVIGFFGGFVAALVSTYAFGVYAVTSGL